MTYRSLRLCPVLVNQIVVYDDGSVSACACRDSEGAMTIGSIDDGIAQLRNGKAFKGMVGDFMARDLSRLPLCRKCDIPYGDTGHEVLT